MIQMLTRVPNHSLVGRQTSEASQRRPTQDYESPQTQRVKVFEYAQEMHYRAVVTFEGIIWDMHPTVGLL